MNKRLLIIAGILVIALIALAGYLHFHKRPTVQTQTASFSVQKKDIANATLPQGFPSDLPVETGSTIQQNYQATTPDGRYQATRVMTTKKPLEQAVKDYSDFFVTKNWVNIPQTENKTTPTALLRSKNNTILISGSTDSGQQGVISITLTQSPPAPISKK